MYPRDNDPLQEIDLTFDEDRRSKPSRPYQHTKRRGGGSKKRVITIVAIVFALLAIGGAAYWYFALRDTSPQQASTENSSQEQTVQTTEPTLSPEEAAQIQTFKSNKLQLEFDHRRDWTVTESSDKTEIIITSPDVGYQTINGTVPEGRGVFTLKITKGANQAQENTVSTLNAVAKSEVVAYDKPTDQQRYYTNISFAGLEDSFTLLIVTGSVEYKKGGALAGTLDIGNGGYYLIAGGFGEDPDNALAFDQVQLSQINSSAVKQATDIIKSLKIY